MIIAQISDTHLTVDEPDSAKRQSDFAAIIEDINADEMPVDAIVHTGDVVHNGRADEYRCAAEILSNARSQVFVIPGNKDDREKLAETLGTKRRSGFIQYSVNDFPVHLVFLDTVCPSHRRGEFCDDRLRDLTRRINEAGSKPAALFLHHPPFEILVGPDKYHYIDMAAMDRLVREINRTGTVAGLFAGHVHRPTFGQIGRTICCVAPAAATSVRFGHYPKTIIERPIYLIHRFERDGNFSSETRVVGGVID